ncbi:MAG TPA: nucleotidyltransferase domain-containing protein [Bacteroidales bacterium]|nr:nucleotidyltransferase domain-containing protein [Bacteroidales bacterium]HPN60342.1 nucleotidyltransferase domain-containing protein [Chitinophagaceae bacterium]
MADEKVINIIRRYVYLLDNEGLGIDKAFLYGSYASGSNSENSDIDLMLVSGLISDNDIQKKSRAWILTKDVDTRIEPYLISTTRFTKDDISPLIEVVKREGIEILL